MEEIKDKLIEPLKYYYEEIKDNFKEETIKFFDELVKKSNIDIELNKSLVGEYKNLTIDRDNIGRKLKFFKFLSAFLLVVGILGLAFSGMLIYSYRYNYYREIVVKIFLISLISIISLFLKFSIISKKITKLTQEFNDLDEKSRQKLYECYKSMLSLNKLMDSKYTFELINKNIPFIKLDPYFSMKRFEELYYVYGLNGNKDKNYSTLEAVSGNILGNPFVILKELRHKIVDHTYTGSLTISWTETYTDSNGNRKTRRVSQTLRASIVRPKPDYKDYVSLILGNDVASNLNFYREPGHIEKVSESALKRKIKKEEKKLNKLEQKTISSRQFVAMANSEFEVLFNALNRDNEMEFRLLFTPLAQQNMVKLLKNKEYGDNFYFIKEKKINTIIAEHTKNWDLDCSAEKFKGYSYDECREYFVNFSTQYFNNFFFTMAPLISIPLYQQYMAKDYIYKTEFNFNYNPYTAETLVNSMGENNFVNERTKTMAILKTTPVSVDGETDLVKVMAYSYDIIPRVEYVTMLGGDGRYHDVPVHWDEYIDLTKESLVELKKLDIDDNMFDEISSSNNISEIFKTEKYTYKSKIFARLSNKGKIESEEVLNSILKTLIK